VNVRLFAMHRTLAGSGSLVLELPAGATVEDAFRKLSRLYPAMEQTSGFTTFARNREVVDRAEPLADGDELALLQPVSGG
jgi:molybdopterin converting factor small subunit